jgi:peptidoglycan/LPS O-acetylase OafA/YrhL
LPELDALRAFAVLLVIVHHWCGPADSPLGPIGVWIFFVLSGFLITRILLDSRSDSPGANRQAIVRFYIRRILRIFPLYYLVLLLAFVTSTTFRSHWSWYVAYLQNFWMIRAASDEQIFGPHLWSLAVEEQFYVVWPLIALFAPRVVLPVMLGSTLGLAVACRCIATAAGWTPFQVYAFTPCNFDMLGLGALLAYVVSYRSDQVVRLRRLACGAAVVILCANALLHIPLLNFSTMALPTGCITFWFIARVVGGVDGIAGRVLRFPPSVYLGRISYGIYVYHYFVPETLTALLRRCRLELDGAPFLAICFIVTVVVASVSWFFFEKPVRSLKDRRYTRAPARDLAVARQRGPGVPERLTGLTGQREESGTDRTRDVSDASGEKF